MPTLLRYFIFGLIISLNTFFVIGVRRKPVIKGPLWVQVSFLFFVVGLAVLIALAFIYTYFRRKSREARIVLSRLEKGDLKARFEIKRFDEIGSLMHAFNRMASEIERLVYRIQETERARKNLLEELGHDVRTPLTSLKTSIETLYENLDEMPKKEQREFLKISQIELGYFLHLIDDLFFVADLGEPRYKKTAQKIDLCSLVNEELHARKSQQKGLNWIFKKRKLGIDKLEAMIILGDPFLIKRLLKNSLDNAAKFAKSLITVQIRPQENSATLIIEDDGPGISEDAALIFGQRRKQRIQKTGCNESISLGLGSVIMKTIVELHGGSLKIESRIKAKVCFGSRLSITLPKS